MSDNSGPAHVASLSRHWVRHSPFSEFVRLVSQGAALGIAISVAVPAAGAIPNSERKEHAKAVTKKKARGAPHLDVSKINDPNNRDSVGPKSEGEAVVRAQILIDRLKFSPGEISTGYDDNFAKAVAAFQAASGLPAIGSMDSNTWALLNDDQSTGHVEQKRAQPPQDQASGGGAPKQNGQPGAPMQAPGQTLNQLSNLVPQGPPPPPAIISYIIAMEDTLGPFTKLPKVTGRDRSGRLLLQEARLRRLNYESPLQLLAEKFHASPRLLVELNPGKRFDREGTQILVPNVLTPAPQGASSVVVDASAHSVTALDKTGKILAFYPASIGSQHDPLPVGNWTIKEIRWYPKFKYNPNLFWDAEDKRPRATLPPGPKSPVGVVWIGLSREHYGIHGTPEPSLIGHTQSHGCIRLTNWDAAELASIVQVGTPALLEEGTPSHAQPQPSSSR